MVEVLFQSLPPFTQVLGKGNAYVNVWYFLCAVLYLGILSACGFLVV